MSLLSKSAYDKLPEYMKPSLRKSEKQIKFADGSVQNSIGIVSIPLQIGSCIETIDFLVGNYTDEAILGMVDITKLKLSVDFAKLLVTKDKMWLPIYDVQESLVGRKVLVRRSVIIPAKSQMLIPAYVQDLKDKHIYANSPTVFEGHDRLKSEIGLFTAKSIHQEIDQDIPILVFNTNTEDLNISNDTVLGELSDIEKINAVNIESETENENETENDKVHSAEVLNAKSSEHVRKSHEETRVPEHIEQVFEEGSVNLNAEEKEKLKSLLISYSDIFSKNDFDIGYTDKIQHKINLKPDQKPIKLPPRRLNPAAREACDQIVDDLLNRGLIRRSKSSW